MDDQVQVEPGDMIAFGSTALGHYGVPRPDADLVARSLVQADLWGHQSHGLLRLPWYAARLASGVMTPVTKPETVIDAGPVVVIDGRQGVGQVLATLAAEKAISLAQNFGVGVVGVRNSNHFGTARYFTQLAPRSGCLAFLSTNASPAIAPWGGRHKALGNNPWSIAAPAGRYGIAVMDLANTVVARGKIYLAHQNGLRLPEGWAITADGEPTTDPLEAIAGTILPMGGPKGYVISFMMDVLSGVLTGSGFAGAVSGPYQAERLGGAGHLYIALNVATFMPPAEFDRSMEQLIEEVKSVPVAPGFEEIYFPGELEEANAASAERDGLFLPQKTVEDLADLAALTGVPLSLRPVG